MEISLPPSGPSVVVSQNEEPPGTVGHHTHFLKKKKTAQQDMPGRGFEGPEEGEGEGRGGARLAV